MGPMVYRKCHVQLPGSIFKVLSGMRCYGWRSSSHFEPSWGSYMLSTRVPKRRLGPWQLYKTALLALDFLSLGFSHIGETKFYFVETTIILGLDHMQQNTSEIKCSSTIFLNGKGVCWRGHWSPRHTCCGRYLKKIRSWLRQTVIY